MLRDGCTAKMDAFDSVPKLGPEVLKSESSRGHEIPRTSSMALRSRPSRSIAERQDRLSPPKDVQLEADSKSKPGMHMCRKRVVILALLLWFFVFAIVMHSIPWGEFEIKWVRKPFSSIQWLYPLSRQECAMGQAYEFLHHSIICDQDHGTVPVLKCTMSMYPNLKAVQDVEAGSYMWCSKAG